MDSETEGLMCEKCQYLQKISSSQFIYKIKHKGVEEMLGIYHHLFNLLNKNSFSLFEMLKVFSFFDKLLQQVQDPSRLKGALFFFILSDQLHWKESFTQRYLANVFSFVSENKTKKELIYLFNTLLLKNPLVELQFSFENIRNFTAQFIRQIKQFKVEALKYFN